MKENELKQLQTLHESGKISDAQYARGVKNILDGTNFGKTIYDLVDTSKINSILDTIQ